MNRKFISDSANLKTASSVLRPLLRKVAILSLLISGVIIFNLYSADEVKAKDEKGDIFEELKFSYKLVVKQSTLKSQTIDYLASNLEINFKNKSVTGTYKEIIPKSAKEVKILFEELKKCL